MDSTRQWTRLWWERLMGLVRRGEGMGFVVGALLCPPELILVNLLRESPSTEIAVCR